MAAKAAPAAVNAAAKAVASGASAAGSQKTSSAVQLAAMSLLRSPPNTYKYPDMVPNPETGGLTYRPAKPLPDTPTLPPMPRLYNKKPRLHPYWKLHPVRKWRDFAPFVSKIEFCFDPSTEGSMGCRELFRQANGTKMNTAFPKCKVVSAVVDDGREATVTITWSNGKSESCVAQWKDFEDILERFEPARLKLQWAAEDAEMN